MLFNLVQCITCSPVNAELSLFCSVQFATQSEGKAAVTVTVRVSVFHTCFSYLVAAQKYLDGFQLMNPTAAFWINYSVLAE